MTTLQPDHGRPLKQEEQPSSPKPPMHYQSSNVVHNVDSETRRLGRGPFHEQSNAVTAYASTPLANPQVVRKAPFDSKKEARLSSGRIRLVSRPAPPKPLVRQFESVGDINIVRRMSSPKSKKQVTSVGRDLRIIRRDAPMEPVIVRQDDKDDSAKPLFRKLDAPARIRDFEVSGRLAASYEYLAQLQRQHARNEKYTEWHERVVSPYAPRKKRDGRLVKTHDVAAVRRRVHPTFKSKKPLPPSAILKVGQRNLFTPYDPKVERKNVAPLVKKHFGKYQLPPDIPPVELEDGTSEAPRFQTQSVGLPVNKTYPRLDSFLIDDFKPVLAMLCSETPSLERKRQSQVDSKYWQEQDLDEEMSMDGIGDILDDITYAPSSQANLRLTYTWNQQRGTYTRSMPPRPTTWTKEALVEYLKAICAVGFRIKKSYKPARRSQTYKSVATEEITAILTDEQLLPHITNQALIVALDFLLRKQNYNDAIHIYRHLRGASFTFSSQTFDMLLFAAAWEKSALYFKPILEHMLDSRFKPTAQTWYTFYKLVNRRYPDKRKEILNAMAKKGSLDEGETVKQALRNALGGYERSEKIDEKKSFSWLP